MSSRFLAAGLAALLLAVPVFANGAPFPRPPVNLTSGEAKLVVLVDANAKKPMLRVPANLVAAKKEDPKQRGQALLGDPSTALAGLALFGAFVSGGFWLVRGKNRRTAAAVACVACLALAGSTAFGDLLPPRPPVLPQIALPGKVQLSGDITIVTTNAPGNVIELVVPGEKPALKPGDLPPPPKGE